MTTVVNAGNGDDTINVGNAGKLNLLLGPVFLNGNAGLIVPLSPILLFIVVVWLLVKGSRHSNALAGGRNSGPPR